MRHVLLILLALVAFNPSDAQTESKADRDKRMSWWRDAAFGMFIHWGAYSVPAGQYHGQEVKGLGEWIMQDAKIPITEYEQFARQFNPTKFDAKEWARIAKDAGVKYIVITSKHHDGFALWDSKVSTYDVVDFSPFKRDILKELTTACKAAGIKMCFYHSIMDWHQPDAKAAKYPHQATERPDWAKYREEYLKPQLKELIVNYDPEVLWFDGEWVDEWTEPQGKELYAYLKKLKPTLIINNRIGKGRKGMNGMNAYDDAAGDFGTPEQEILEGTSDYDWESCMTMNDTWGFKTNDHNWKSSETLIHNLVDIAAKGGNYLLNIGPKSDGTIPTESVERLGEMGKWLKVNGEAIYGTSPRKEYKEGSNIRFTVSADGKTTYAILTKVEGKQVVLSTVANNNRTKVSMLGYDGNLKVRQDDGKITIDLPDKLPGNYAWTIKIQN
ncbi:MAG TPA: alpha-L-fucosidase [Cyclobacteriaceae bacterium]|nr:alpha-L-fucosidase [Cyclobacteriaceae bacterium]